VSREPLPVRITIMEYDSRWPLLFELEARRIRFALGESALSIDHAGSTAVPGLAAKPVIDILLVVGDSAAENDYLPALEEAGYRLTVREPGWNEHRMCNGPDTDINLHVFTQGCPEIGRMTDFRDWLRNNAADRERYAAKKRELALNNWESTQSYADAKTGIIQEIMTRACVTASPRG
jgi:GrpB-like predicted nucleotidyltransferase (UPF0157 family)